LALNALNGQSVNTNNPEMDSLFIDAARGHGGTKLQIESGLKKLIQHNQE
jgi:hypothetical protein